MKILSLALLGLLVLIVCSLESHPNADLEVEEPVGRLSFSEASSQLPGGKSFATQTLNITCSRHEWKSVADGVFFSPRYSKKYLRNENCVYLITAPKGNFVSLKSVERFILDPTNGKLIIRDGDSLSSPLLLEVSGRLKKLPKLESTGRNMFIQFISQGKNKGLRGRFKIGYEFISDRNLFYAATSSGLVRLYDPNGLQLAEFNSSIGGHSVMSDVYGLAKMKNGFLASGANDYSIRLWDLKNQKLNYTFNEHSDTVMSLVELKNGYLASGSWDNSIKIFDVEKQQVKKTFGLSNNGHTDGVNRLAVLQNGLLASGSKDNTVKIWNVTSEQIVVTFDSSKNGHEDWVTSLAVLPNGFLVSGGFDIKIKVWNVENQNIDHSFSQSNSNMHSNAISSLAVLNNGYLASGSLDLSIKIWDVVNRNVILTLGSASNRHTNAVNTLLVLSNGLLLSGSSDFSIKLWNVSSSSNEPIWTKDIQQMVNALVTA